MLSPETLESYRRMTPGERLRLTFELCRPAWRALTEGDRAIVARRFERLRQENDLRNQRMIEGFRRSEQAFSTTNTSSETSLPSDG
jgi:hypothetical protein